MLVKIRHDGLRISADSLAADRIRPGDIVEIRLHKPVISDKQRAFYFTYLTWCIEHGLKEYGHFSAEGLHEDIKAYIKTSRHAVEYPVVSVSQRGMNKARFEMFLMIVDSEIINEFFQINTANFWQEYEEIKAAMYD